MTAGETKLKMLEMKLEAIANVVPDLIKALQTQGMELHKLKKEFEKQKGRTLRNGNYKPNNK